MKPQSLFGILALAFCSQAGAQMHKCQDAAGKITYSSQDCAEIGLKPAGEVRDRINVTPAYKPPPGPRPAAQARPAAQDPAPKAAAEPEKKDPERRCFTVKTAKGMVTRCNDKPEEDGRK